MAWLPVMIVSRKMPGHAGQHRVNEQEVLIISNMATVFRGLDKARDTGIAGGNAMAGGWRLPSALARSFSRMNCSQPLLVYESTRLESLPPLVTAPVNRQARAVSSGDSRRAAGIDGSQAHETTL